MGHRISFFLLELLASSYAGIQVAISYMQLEQLLVVE